MSTPTVTPAAPVSASSAVATTVSPGGTTTPTTSPSSPSSTPATGAPASDPSGTGASSGASGVDTSFDWMNSVFDNGEPSPASPASPTGQTTAPAAPTAATTPPAPEPVATTPTAPPAQTSPQVTEPPGTLAAQPAPAAPTQSPQFDPADPLSLAQALSRPENTAAAIEHLANGVLKLSPQDLEALESDPGSAIPKLLARSVVFAQQQMLTQLGNIVPLMIQGQQKVAQAHEQSLAKFYSSWPGLDRGKHHEKVVEMGIRYRQMFPNSTLDQMIEHLGPLVLTSVGIPLTAMTKVGSTAPATPVQTPQAAPQIKPNGFVPAAPGAVVQTQQVEADPFSYMGGQS